MIYVLVLTIFMNGQEERFDIDFNLSHSDCIARAAVIQGQAQAIIAPGVYADLSAARLDCELDADMSESLHAEMVD